MLGDILFLVEVMDLARVDFSGILCGHGTLVCCLICVHL